MKIDWLEKLRILLQAWAFCLAVSAVQQAFQSDRPYELPLVYSMCIGTATWALVDLGRELFPSSHKAGRGTGWPEGFAGISLPFVGIVGGYFLGTLAGDAWFGWSSWDANPHARAQLPVSIIVTAVAGVAGVYYFYSRNKALWLEKEAQELQRQAAESKLKLLEAQIEPHMLFNTLANLRVLVQTDAGGAVQMLDHLNGYLRSTLSASRQPLHPLTDEFARIRDYLELMAVRMGPRLRFKLDLPPALAQHPVPPLILQPLVENAIQHGLEPSVEGGSIHVAVAVDGTRLQLVVEDSGVGFSANASATSAPQPGGAGGGGFGLTQVRERLATFYGPEAALEIGASRGRGTRVLIQFPLKTAAAATAGMPRVTR